MTGLPDTLVSPGVFPDDTSRMNTDSLNVVFLSTDGLEHHVIDDDLALEPLSKDNIQAKRYSWRDKKVEWSAFDLIIVRSTWDYHEHCDAFFEVLEQLDQAGPLLANPLAVMRWNRRKTYLRDLQSQGIAIVDTCFGDRMDVPMLDQLIAQFASGSWIVKPDVGASAGGVVLLHGKPDATTRQALLTQFASTGFLAQPFVDAVTATGEYSVFFFDGVFSHCILKSPKAGDFRVQEEHGGHIRAVEMPVEVAVAARRVYAALPADCLYVRVDLVANSARQFLVMEVELIEPSLYLRTHPDAPQNFALAVRRWYDRVSA